MTNHFSVQSAMFYGIAITAVTTLFMVASTFGEANLKAPNRIGGQYQIAIADVPECLKTNSLLLIQQSGIYLTGSLVSADAAPGEIQKAQERPPLNGRWQNGQLMLQGPLRSLPSCQGSIRIQGTIQGIVERGVVKQASLDGTIDLSASGNETRFTAQQRIVQPVLLEGH